MGLISLVVWRVPLLASYALALSDERYTQILLILPISAALILANWPPSELSEGPCVRPGLAWLLVSILAYAFVRSNSIFLASDVQLSAEMLTLVSWWAAAFLLCFGARSFRASIFPLCFLLWIVPPPLFVLNSVVHWLQQGSAASAHFIFSAAGVPVAQTGMLVHIPGLTLEVAAECSSIRSSLLLLITTLVIAHVLLRSWWRRLVVIGSALPLSIAKNGLRIFVIGMLSTHVDPSFLTGRLHRQGGIIFFIIALAAVFSLIWILRISEEKLGMENEKLRAKQAPPAEKTSLLATHPRA
jgi:exosortase